MLISEITTPTGETMTYPSDILPSDFRPVALKDLLDPLVLGWLLDREREVLVQPFTALEVLNAIQSFPSGKALGPDGLPIDFYRSHGKFLAPLLASLYTQCLTEGKLPTSMYHA